MDVSDFRFGFQDSEDFVHHLSVRFLRDVLGEEAFEEFGPAIQFWDLADKYYKELEKEMGNENPPSLQEAMRKPKAADEEN